MTYPASLARDLGPAPVTEFRGAYWFLSNPYPCPVSWEGRAYPSSEHAWHAAKTLDEQPRYHIQQTAGWREAKAFGHTVQLRPGWERLRRGLMTQILLAKFMYDDDLRDRLLSTGTRCLLEGNSWGDTDWGAVPWGHAKWDSALPSWHTQAGVWSGRNWLGLALMTVRDVLSEG